MKDLQERMAARREEKRLKEIEEDKAKEKIRRMSAKEIAESKEKLQAMEIQKAMEQRKREKEEDRLAKARIKAQIEADKLERQRKVGIHGSQYGKSKPFIERRTARKYSAHCSSSGACACDRSPQTKLRRSAHSSTGLSPLLLS